MRNKWLFLGSLFMFLAVAIGAFGAHGLKNILNDEMKAIFETGNKYHFYHALALLVVGMVSESKYTSRWVEWSGYAFVVGIVVFAGTLYALAITEIRILGAITPIGGVCFLLGWFFLILNYWKRK